MKRYDYIVSDKKDFTISAFTSQVNISKLQSILDKLGEQGYRLVCEYQNALIFEREIIEDE